MGENIESPFLTGAEVAAYLRMPEETLRYHAWKGTGPKSVKIGRRRLYRKADVEAWITEREARERVSA